MTAQMQYSLACRHIEQDVVKGVAAELETTATAVSLAWLLGKPVISSIIIGPKTVEQQVQNLEAAKVKLSEEHVARLEEASAPPPRYPEGFIGWTQRAE